MYRGHDRGSQVDTAKSIRAGNGSVVNKDGCFVKSNRYLLSPFGWFKIPKALVLSCKKTFMGIGFTLLVVGRISAPVCIDVEYQELDTTVMSKS